MFSCSVMSVSLQPHGLQLARLLCLWDSPCKNTGVGCHALLQGIFLMQGSNPGLPHCRRILYQMSHQGSPGLGIRPYYSNGKESACNTRDPGSILGSRRSPGVSEWQPTPVFLHGESHGQRSLAGHSPWGCKESVMTEVT